MSAWSGSLEIRSYNGDILWGIPLIPFSQEMENNIVEDRLPGLPSLSCSRGLFIHLISAESLPRASHRRSTESKSRFVSVCVCVRAHARVFAEWKG